MAYSYQVPQPPKKHTLRTVLIVVGSVLVLCCGGVGVGGYFLYNGVKDAAGPALKAAEAFVGRLEAGDAAGAYGLLCSDTQGLYTQEAFVDGVGKQPQIRSHSVNGVYVSNMNGKTTATVSMALTLDTGFADQHTFPLLQEGDAWKVCGRPY